MPGDIKLDHSLSPEEDELRIVDSLIRQHVLKANQAKRPPSPLITTLIKNVANYKMKKKAEKERLQSAMAAFVTKQQ